jgi:hypothetical protein
MMVVDDRQYSLFSHQLFQIYYQNMIDLYSIIHLHFHFDHYFFQTWYISSVHRLFILHYSLTSHFVSFLFSNMVYHVFFYHDSSLLFIIFKHELYELLKLIDHDYRNVPFFY